MVIFKWGFTVQLLNCRSVTLMTHVQTSPTKQKKNTIKPETRLWRCFLLCSYLFSVFLFYFIHFFPVLEAVSTATWTGHQSVLSLFVWCVNGEVRLCRANETTEVGTVLKMESKFISLMHVCWNVAQLNGDIELFCICIMRILRYWYKQVMADHRGHIIPTISRYIFIKSLTILLHS